MSEMTSSRKLAAIMFTDIVGYTSLMGKDSDKALQILKISKEFQQSLVKEHHGKWLKEIGDGVMVQFDSAIDAVRCAIAIQENARAKLDAKLRIGIHLGDVAVEANDIYGDGVNVASRLEAITDPGGIYISDNVEKSIRGQSGIQAKYLGEVQLKNVDYDVRIYAVLGVGLPEPEFKPKKKSPFSLSKKAGVGTAVVLIVLVLLMMFSPRLTSETKASEEEVSMAVIPFFNLSTDSTTNKYGLGMASAIATSLSMSKGFDFVSSDQATFRFANKPEVSPENIGEQLNVTHLITGTFQIVEDQISINVQMVDASNGKRLWDFPVRDDLKNIFNLQDRIGEEIIDYFSFQSGERSRGTDNLEAYEHYLDARELEKKQGTPNYHTTIAPIIIDHYQQSISLDSGYMDAWTGLISAQAYRVWMNQTNQTVEGNELFTPEERQEQIAIIESEIEYMDRFPDSWVKDVAKGIYAYHVRKNYDEGERLFLRALSKNPNSYEANSLLGSIYWRKMDHENAIRYKSAAAKLDHADPEPWFTMGIVFGDNGDYERSYLAREEAWKRGRSGGLWMQSIFHHVFPDTSSFDEEKIKALGDQFYIQKFSLQRDWNGLKLFLDSTQTEQKTPRDIARRAVLHFGMGNMDSVRFYAVKYVEIDHEHPELNLQIAYNYALLGERDKALDAAKNVWNVNLAEGQDRVMTCRSKFWEILILTLLQDYENATKTLIRLNEEYPELGNYIFIQHFPEFDKIKKEHPPFVEALENLKLPPRIGEGVIDLL